MSDFNHSSVLFIQEDAQPIKFYMRPCPEKQRLRPLIEHGGGLLTSKWSNDVLRLVLPDSRKSTEEGISSKYIDDCVQKNCLLDASPYRIKLDSVSVSDISDGENDSKYRITTTARNIRARKEYTEEDDQIIINYLLKTNRFDDVKGNRIWMDLEDRKLLPRRTWQSLKERYRKKVIPNIHRYNLKEKQKKLLKRPFGCDTDSYSDDAMSVSSNDDKNDYSIADDFTILNFLFEKERYTKVSEDEIWKELESKGILSYPWDSIKERFFKLIVPSIKKYNLSLKQINMLKKVVKLKGLTGTLGKDENPEASTSKCISISSLSNSSKSITVNSEQAKKTVEESKLPKEITTKKYNGNNKEEADQNDETSSKKNVDETSFKKNSKLQDISWSRVLQNNKQHVLCKDLHSNQVNKSPIKTRMKSNQQSELRSPEKTEMSSSTSLSYFSNCDVLTETDDDKNKNDIHYKDRTSILSNKGLFEKFISIDIEEYLGKCPNEGKENAKEELEMDCLKKKMIDNLRKCMLDKLHGKDESAKGKNIDNIDSGLILELYQNKIKSAMNMNKEGNLQDLSTTESKTVKNQPSTDVNSDLDIQTPLTLKKITDILDRDSSEISDKGISSQETDSSVSSQEESINMIIKETKTDLPNKNLNIQQTNSSEESSPLLNKLREKIKSIVNHNSPNKYNCDTPMPSDTESGHSRVLRKEIGSKKRVSKYRKLTNGKKQEQPIYSESNSIGSKHNRLRTLRRQKRNISDAITNETKIDLQNNSESFDSTIHLALNYSEKIEKICNGWLISSNLANVSIPSTSLNSLHQQLQELRALLYKMYLMSLSHTILKKSQNDVTKSDILILLKYLVTHRGFSIGDMSKLIESDAEPVDVS